MKYCGYCGKEIKESSEFCPYCGKKCKNQKIKEVKKIDKSKLKKIFLFIGIGIVALVAIVVSAVVISDKNEEKTVQTECERFTKSLQEYIDNKDYKGLEEKGWFDHGSLTTDECSDIPCSCPSAWDLYIKNKTLIADDYLSEGLISSAYNAMGSNYIDEYPIMKAKFDNTNIFKLISTKQKEDITGISYLFGEWSWKYEVGGNFSFNKRFVNYGSSNLSLKFDNYFDKVLMSGHMASSKHPNWNSEKNISVNWYNYKILDNKIYVKLETEANNAYDALFEIVSLDDYELKLKLLIDTTDVNAGQVYTFKYVRT